jgi:hypothetical protein
MTTFNVFIVDDSECGCGWYQWGKCGVALGTCGGVCVGTWGTGCIACMGGLQGGCQGQSPPLSLNRFLRIVPDSTRMLLLLRLQIQWTRDGREPSVPARVPELRPPCQRFQLLQVDAPSTSDPVWLSRAKWQVLV